MQNSIPVLGIIASVLLLPGYVLGADAHPDGNSPVVEVNGVTLNLSDLERKSSAALFQARSVYYEAERRTLEEFINDYLLEQQALKEKVSVAELLERHVNSTIAPKPSDEALRVYYEGIETTASYEEVRDKIADVVRDKRIAKAKVAYIQSLRNQAHITYRLAPPRAPISLSDAPARGPQAAPVTLLEYADYECPYCQQIQPVLEKLAQEYKGKLAFAYKDFPLPMHPNAQKAAEASRCAQLQGKYWEYHDLLVTTKQLDLPALKSHSRTLKLDANTFDKCLDTGDTAETVKKQASEAQSLGVSGTPTFFVNGRPVSGDATYEKLRGIIAEELSAAEAGSAVPAAVGTTQKKGAAQ